MSLFKTIRVIKIDDMPKEFHAALYEWASDLNIGNSYLRCYPGMDVDPLPYEKWLLENGVGEDEEILIDISW